MGRMGKGIRLGILSVIAIYRQLTCVLVVLLVRAVEECSAF